MTEGEVTHLAARCAKCGEPIAVPIDEVEAAGGINKVQHAVCPREIDVTPRLSKYRMEIRIFKGDEAEPIAVTAVDAEAVALSEAMDELGPRLSANWARLAENAWMADT